MDLIEARASKCTPKSIVLVEKERAGRMWTAMVVIGRGARDRRVLELFTSGFHLRLFLVHNYLTKSTKDGAAHERTTRMVLRSSFIGTWSSPTMAVEQEEAVYLSLRDDYSQVRSELTEVENFRCSHNTEHVLGVEGRLAGLFGFTSELLFLDMEMCNCRGLVHRSWTASPNTAISTQTFWGHTSRQ